MSLMNKIGQGSSLPNNWGNKAPSSFGYPGPLKVQLASRDAVKIRVG
jgi:hypothetical protein